MTLITNLTLLQTLKLSPPHNHDDRNDHPFPPSPLPYHHQHCLDQRGSPGYIIIIITEITTMSTNILIILLFLLIIDISLIREGLQGIV